jgi:predicted DNA-binding ribbon-helix-helix protein
MDEFLRSLSLPSNIVKDTKDILEREAVSFEQLLNQVTDEELAEIGVSQSARNAIEQGIKTYRAKQVIVWLSTPRKNIISQQYEI